MVQGIPALRSMSTYPAGTSTTVDTNQGGDTNFLNTGSGDVVVFTNNQFNLFSGPQGEEATADERTDPGSSADPSTDPSTDPSSTDPSADPAATDEGLTEYLKTLRTAMEKYKTTGDDTDLQALVPDDATREGVIAQADREKFYSDNTNVQKQIDTLLEDADPSVKTDIEKLSTLDPESTEAQEISARLDAAAAEDPNVDAARRLANVKYLNGIEEPLRQQYESLDPNSEEAGQLALRLMALDIKESDHFNAADEILPFEGEEAPESEDPEEPVTGSGVPIPLVPPGTQINNPFLLVGFGFPLPTGSNGTPVV